MGMEVTLEATIEVTLPDGTKRTMAERFPCWHTTTKTTKKIIRSPKEEQAHAYKDWLHSLLPVEEDDTLEERRNGHIRHLEQWLEDHKDWDIEWGEI